MYREVYKKLLNKLKDFGASEKFLQSVCFYSLENEAKVRLELRKYQDLGNSLQTTNYKNQISVSESKESNASYSLYTNSQQLITDFPLELHGVYCKRKDFFLQACSLKIQLNTLVDADAENALKIQQKIFELFEKIDSLNTILEHWTTHKRILKTNTKVDFSLLSAMELLQKRNTLRSNLTSRKKTLAKLQEQSNDTLLTCDKIIKKQEDIKEIELQIEKINELIKRK